MKKFGDRLRELRENRELKQQDVARELFISNKVLSTYERNIAYPSIDLLKRICEFYNVSADYLLQTEINLPSEEPQPDAPKLVSLTQEQTRILSYYERLNREHKDAVRGLMVLYFKEQQHKS